MKVTVKINTKNAHKIPNCKAFVSITLDNALSISGVKLMDGKNGLFLSYPSYKSGDKYHDYIYPLTKEAREGLTKKVIEEYNKTAVTDTEASPFE